MNKLVTSGYIAKLFKQADKNTIIRRPNLRRFAEQNDVEYYVHDTAWLINFDDFMSKINPQGEQVKCEMPLLRNKHGLVGSEMCIRDSINMPLISIQSTDARHRITYLSFCTEEYGL